MGEKVLPPRQFFSSLFVLAALFSLSAAAVVINISGRVRQQVARLARRRPLWVP